jgi:hypothetical protein
MSVNSIIIIGLGFNLIASVLIAYGRIFRSKRTIRKESETGESYNVHEEKHRLIETRIAQAGALLLVVGFTLQVIGNVFD